MYAVIIIMMTISNKGWKVRLFPPRRYVPFETPRVRFSGIVPLDERAKPHVGFMGSSCLTYLAPNISSGGPSWFSICTVVGDVGRGPQVLRISSRGLVGQCSCWSKSFAEHGMAAGFADVIPTCRDMEEANSRDGRLLS